MNSFVCRKDYPVVQTEAGKLRGYVWNGTFIFKGIKYADAKRFRRPEKVEPWEGVKDAQSYGMVCPLLQQDTPGGELMVPHMYWPMDEHCQYLNIWTQSIDREAKKPVMVWLHGGGFFAGSSIEQLAYDGENMSRYGDVVVVSLNHRLNVLGYLDLSPFGEEYKDSANVGNLDMIAALQWVQENIAGFGGDPDNVTIFGQSGGGAKVWTLMQMAEADGLFHKGIIQSGVYGMMDDVEGQDGTQIVEQMLKLLKNSGEAAAAVQEEKKQGLDDAEGMDTAGQNTKKKNAETSGQSGSAVPDVKILETLPYAKLAELYNQAAPAVQAQGGYVGGSPHMGELYAGNPVRHGFRAHAKEIPLLIGTVLGEFDFWPPIPGKQDLTAAQTDALLQKRYGEAAERVKELFVQAYPDKLPVEALAVDTLFRAPTIRFIEERAKTPSSQTYSYQFTYTFPLHDGKIAWHCSEIPFVFHNIDKVPVCNKDEKTEQLQENIFGAWIQFARTGKPEIEGVTWPACSAGDEAVMILDETCEVRHNVDHELVALLEGLPVPEELMHGEIQH